MPFSVGFVHSPFSWLLNTTQHEQISLTPILHMGKTRVEDEVTYWGQEELMFQSWEKAEDISAVVPRGRPRDDSSTWPLPTGQQQCCSLTSELLAALRSFCAHQTTFPLTITSCVEVFPNNGTAGANVFTSCKKEAGKTGLRDKDVCRGKWLLQKKTVTSYHPSDEVLYVFMLSRS